MQIANIPAKFNIPFASSAGASYIRAVPQVPTGTTGQASLQTGFPPANFNPVAAGGVPPFGSDFNGILNQITAWNQFQAAGGVAQYDSVFATAIGGYPLGAVIASAAASGLLWMSTADNNLNNPDVAPTNWVQIVSGVPQHVQRGDWTYWQDTGSTNSIVITPSPAITAYVPGLRFDVRLANNITGPTVINVSGLGVKNVVNGDGTSLSTGHGVAGQVLGIVFDGTSFQVENILSTNFRANTYVVYGSHGSFIWTCPYNVSQVKVRMCGAGGGGGGSFNAGAGAGGNAGAYIEGIYSVSQGASYSISIGQGGAAGVAGGTGGTGGTTSFNGIVTITGGGGGGPGSNGGGTTGASSGTTGTFGFSAQGTSGQYGSVASGSFAAGGFGGASVFSGPAFCPICTSTASPLTGYTNNNGGGGSGGSSLSGSGAPGGAGGDGLIILEY